MPNRKQKDCSKGKIYFIRSNNPEIKSKYVGSTIQTLAKRMATHRSNYKQWLKDESMYSCSIFYEFKKYGVEQFHIELIEDYPCERDEQLLARENFFIRKEDCVNKKSAILIPEEYKEHKKQYYLEHKEEKKIYNQKYIQEHKEEIKTQRKEYYDKNNEVINCVCGCQIRKQCLAKHLKTKKHLNLIAEKNIK